MDYESEPFAVAVFKHDYIKQCHGPLLRGINFFFFVNVPFFPVSPAVWGSAMPPQFLNLTSRGDQNCLWVNWFKHKQAQIIHTKSVWIFPDASIPLNHVRSHILHPQTWLDFHSDRAWRISQGPWCFVRQELVPFLDALQMKVSLRGARAQTDPVGRSFI